VGFPQEGSSGEMQAVSAAIQLFCRGSIEGAGPDDCGFTSIHSMKLKVEPGADPPVASGCIAHEIGHAIGTHLPPGGSQLVGDLKYEDYELDPATGMRKDREGREGSIMGTAGPGKTVKPWTACELVRKEGLCPDKVQRGKQKGNLKCCPGQQDWTWAPGSKSGETKDQHEGRGKQPEPFMPLSEDAELGVRLLAVAYGLDG
jgi:hypothetical protein